MIELGRLSVGHPATTNDERSMNLYATLSPWDEDRGRFKGIGEGSWPGVDRCGGKGKRKDGREVAVPGMSGIGKRY